MGREGGGGEAGLERGVKTFFKNGSFSMWLTWLQHCGHAQPPRPDTAATGYLLWASRLWDGGAHCSPLGPQSAAGCSGLSPGEPCARPSLSMSLPAHAPEGHAWPPLHRSVPNHTQPAWAGAAGSGSNQAGSHAGLPSTRGAHARGPMPGSVRAAVVSPGFCYSCCIFMVSYNKMQCQTPPEAPHGRGQPPCGEHWHWGLWGAGCSLGCGAHR